jgi:hypothetical protein
MHSLTDLKLPSASSDASLFRGFPAIQNIWTDPGS